ncbi:small-conductance mechanosensitive channel [Sphingomonas vulcanisoli]|uniref:Small-conductance mechanosensitive channel n=1 Tax=Sphingomonas vulcanisoli TaxID=1658060 RepID=A0ABX0TUI2_9SPHN|nr:mechanosensitive ion channel domain-containing protein [Sphingomonas vulcanisoli]NIJ09189.1 small-conductance mechanosensitive channel [Sphingomonas vulcanisoli]
MPDATTTNAAVAAHKPPPLIVSRTAFQQLFDQSWNWLLRHYLQIGIAVAVATVLVLAMLGLRTLATRLCARQDKWLTHWPRTLGRVTSKTSIVFMVLFAAKLVDGYADPPVMVAQTINVLFTIASAIQVAIWVRELVMSLVEHRAGGGNHAGLSSAVGIIRMLVTTVLFAITAVAILDNLGVNVTGVIAGLGIGGIAIGLAAKGIFDDLFSALSIIFDRPFSQGDSITWDKTSGTVEAIGLKTTRVRAVTGEEVVISNTNLLNKELHNMARLNRRRIVTTLGLAYYTPPEVCERVPQMVKKVVEDVPKCKLVRCGLSEFGASSLDFQLQYDVQSSLYDEVFNARHEVSVRILQAFNDAGIDFAWPTQTTIEAGPDGKPVRPSAGVNKAAARSNLADPAPMPVGPEEAPE